MSVDVLVNFLVLFVKDSEPTEWETVGTRLHGMSKRGKHCDSTESIICLSVF